MYVYLAVSIQMSELAFAAALYRYSSSLFCSANPLLMTRCVSQVMSCTPVPNQALHHEPPSSNEAPSALLMGAACQLASDTHMTNASQGATDASTTTAEQTCAEPDDGQQDVDSNAVNRSKAQQGTKRKRSDADAEADVIMTNADPIGDAGERVNHAEHQQQQQGRRSNGHMTADSSAGLLTGSVLHQPHQGGVIASDAAQIDADIQDANHLTGAQNRPGVLQGHSLHSNGSEVKHLEVDTRWGDKLGRVVQWCWRRLVSEHLCTELQVGSSRFCSVVHCQHLQMTFAAKITALCVLSCNPRPLSLPLHRHYLCFGAL